MLTHFKKMRARKNNFLKIICFTTLMLNGALQAMDALAINERLWNAVKDGNIVEVAQLLKKGANPNAEENSYRHDSMLLTSAMLGHLEICK